MRQEVPGWEHGAGSEAHVLSDHRRMMALAASQVRHQLRVGEGVRIDGLQLAVHRDSGWLAGVVPLATSLAERGRRVILAGTDTDFRGEPFGPMPQLMAVAEVVDKLHAICVLCGSPASRNQRLIEGMPARYDSPTIMVGGQEAYEARCRACHQVPREDEDQGRLL